MSKFYFKKENPCIILCTLIFYCWFISAGSYTLRLCFEPQFPPWSFTTPSNNGTLLGVMADVYDALEHALEYKIILEEQHDHQWGALLPNGTFSGMVGAVSRKEADTAGPFFVSEQRYAVIDYSNCLHFAKLGIMTGIQVTDRNLFLYFNVFTWQVWLSLLIGVLICTVVSVLLYDVSLKGCKDNQVQLFLRFWWNFWSYLSAQDPSSTNHWPVKQLRFKLTFRILLGAWLLGPVVVSLFSFQGSITSTFAVTKMRPVISGMDDLLTNQKVVPVIPKGSGIDICFRESPEYANLYKRMRNESIELSAENVELTLKKVERGTHVLIVEYVYGLSKASDWVTRHGHCGVQVEDLLFCQTFTTLGFAKDFDPALKRRIDKQVTFIYQAKLTDRWLNRVYNNYTHCSRLPPAGSKPLSITDVLGGFSLWGFGMMVSLVALVFERMGKCMQNQEEYRGK